MATPLKPDRIVIRETAPVYRMRPLIIELHPGYLTLRQKGKQTKVTLDYGTAFEAAFKILWREQQREKKAKKKGKKAKTKK